MGMIRCGTNNNNLIHKTNNTYNLFNSNSCQRKYDKPEIKTKGKMYGYMGGFRRETMENKTNECTSSNYILNNNNSINYKHKVGSINNNNNNKKSRDKKDINNNNIKHNNNTSSSINNKVPTHPMRPLSTYCYY